MSNFYTKNIENFFEAYNFFFKKEEISSFKAQKTIRINTLKINPKIFIEHMEKTYGYSLQKVFSKIENIYFIKKGDAKIPIGKTIEHFLGLFYIQDLSSMIPVLISDIKQKELILDMTASPGSKSTQILEKLNHTGFLIANELSSKRSTKLFSNIKRLGFINYGITNYNGSFFGKFMPNTFDKIFLDPSCSNEGKLENLNTWNKNLYKKFVKNQKKLIESAFLALKQNGTLIYSTCTFSPYENEAIIDFLIKKYSELIQIEKIDFYQFKSNGILQFEKSEFDQRIKNTLHILPHTHNCNGFFIAKLKKTGKTKINKFQLNIINNKIKINKSHKHNLLLKLKKIIGNFDIKIFKKYDFYKYENYMYICPKIYKTLSQSAKFQNIGVLLGQLDKSNNIIIHTYFLWVFGYIIQNNIYKINEKEAYQLLEGKNLKVKIQDGSYFLKYKNFGILGIGKVKNNILKNNILKKYLKI